MDLSEIRFDSEAEGGGKKVELSLRSVKGIRYGGARDGKEKRKEKNREEGG